MSKGDKLAGAVRKDGSIGIGVCCFHFGLTKSPPYEMTVQQYADTVRRALESVQTINDIEIVLGEEASRLFGLDSDDDVGDIEDGNAFPLPSFFSVSFTLFIPTRIQEELGRKAPFPSTGSESFFVQIHYQYASPVCIVIPLAQSGEHSPSASIPTVREYLRGAINTFGSEVRFGALGPSPVHADFFVYPAVGQEDVVCTEFQRQHGYASVKIKVSATETDAVQDLIWKLFPELLYEADTYYHVVALRVEALRRWREFEREFGPVMDSPDDVPIWRRIPSHARRAELIHKANLELTRFEYFMASSRYEARQDFEEHYQRAQVTYMKPILEAEIAKEDVFPTEHFAKMLSFLEARRSQSFEMLVVLVAAIVGGIAGSTLTVWVGK